MTEKKIFYLLQVINIFLDVRYIGVVHSFQDGDLLGNSLQLVTDLDFSSKDIKRHGET